jgi:hypothetical protein
MNSKLAKFALLIILSAVCANAEWTFDNDKEVQERGDKRDEEREEARKALDRVRFGVKVGVLWVLMSLAIRLRYILMHQK